MINQGRSRCSSYLWIKFWTESWLTGTARHSLSPAERSVVVDLFCLAKRKDGIIEILNRSAQARMLLISRRLLDTTLDKAVKLDILSRHPGPELGSATETFLITKWETYQGRSAKKGKAIGATNDPELADREEETR